MPTKPLRAGDVFPNYRRIKELREAVFGTRQRMAMAIHELRKQDARREKPGEIDSIEKNIQNAERPDRAIRLTQTREMATVLGVEAEELIDRDRGKAPRKGASAPTIVFCYRDQEHWAREYLVPCLRATGMPLWLIVGPAYLQEYESVLRDLYPTTVARLLVVCSRTEEAQRLGAEAGLPGLEGVLAVIRGRDGAPLSSNDSGLRCVDFGDDRNSNAWDLLLGWCCSSLGISPLVWFQTRDEIRKHLLCHESVNLVVSGSVAWRGLVDSLSDEHLGRLGVVDLMQPAVATRPHFIAQLLAQACGVWRNLKEPADLIALSQELSTRTKPALIALLNADMFRHHVYKDDVPLFAALRFLVRDQNKLVVLIHSRTDFDQLMPPEYNFSPLDLYMIRLTASR
jgi:hypothetical protein